MKLFLPTTLALISLVAPLIEPNLLGGQPVKAASAKLNTHPHSFTLTYSKSKIRVIVKNASWQVQHKDVVEWVKDATNSIVSYYGKFPLKETVIIVKPTNDAGVGFATASYNDHTNQGVIKVNLGKYSTKRDLKHTWTLTHEMAHLTFPLVNNRYNWLTEGIATYVEPIGRMRQGLISKDKMWSDLIDDLPQGQPQWGDRGLNNTHTWGRTYWGGALFCFVADIQLRKTTNNKQGLEQALRGIMNAGLTAQSNVLNAQDILSVADRKTNTKVLTSLYNQMKDRPVRVNLSSLWKQLGVSKINGRVYYNNKAPLAHIRRAIETGKN